MCSTEPAAPASTSIRYSTRGISQRALKLLLAGVVSGESCLSFMLSVTYIIRPLGIEEEPFTSVQFLS